MKYRVYDKGIEQYTNANYVLDANNDAWQIFYSESLDRMVIAEVTRDTFIFEQFTGLLDKNGVEIYEGNIVSELGGTYEVYFNKYMFALKDYYDQSFDAPSDGFSEGVFEVISNIHDK